MRRRYGPGRGSYAWVRHLSFLFFVCVGVIFVTKVLQASPPNCTTFLESACLGRNDRYGGTCIMVSTEGDECASLGEACSSYCNGSVTQSNCGPNPGGGTSGQCWCGNSSQCTCGGSSESCTLNSQCCSGLICNQIDGRCSTNESPILINLASNGWQDDLTSAEDGVLFDLNPNGRPEPIAWTKPNAPAGFLALDRNGNGTIDDGTELFGNYTPMRDGTLAANGFEAINDLDRMPGPGRNDGRIDSRDQVYAQLRLWLDRNHNGISESDELLPLGQAGVNTIFTRYRESRRVDQHGNEYRYVGIAVIERNGRELPRRIYDVYLNLAPTT